MKKMRLILLTTLIALIAIGGLVYAGKVYTLNSAVTTTAVTGSALSIDGQYKDWAFQATCTGNMNADSAPATMTIEGSVDGTSYDTIATQAWTTTTSAAKHVLFRPTTSPIPLAKIRGKWSTVSWTTSGSCSLKALGVN